MHSIMLFMPFSLHGRNATKITQIVNKYSGNVTFEKVGVERRCNGKSLIGTLSLGVEQYDTISIVTDSPEYERMFEEIKGTIEEIITLTE